MVQVCAAKLMIYSPSDTQVAAGVTLELGYLVCFRVAQ